MKPAIPESLILSLIKYDLLNTKLVLGLNQLGLNADDYLTGLSTTIFSLMGHGNGPDTEPLYDGYRQLAERAQYMELRGLDGLVAEIYVYLDARIKSQEPR